MTSAQPLTARYSSTQYASYRLVGVRQNKDLNSSIKPRAVFGLFAWPFSRVRALWCAVMASPRSMRLHRCACAAREGRVISARPQGRRA